MWTLNVVSRGCKGFACVVFWKGNISLDCKIRGTLCLICEECRMSISEGYNYPKKF